MRQRTRTWHLDGAWFGAAMLVALAGCGSDEPAPTDAGTGGTSGSGGTTTGGAAGDGGSAGTGTGGTGGTNTGGTGGTGTGGTGGDAGSAGAGPLTCSTCHGSPTNPAPPLDLDRNDDTSLPSVGAHQAHLDPSGSARPVSCSECHVVPTEAGWNPSVPSHMNGINDISWGPLAQSGTYDPDTNTCSSTYCHGATLERDAVGAVSNRTPTWTIVDGSQASCGTSCHTLPPGGSHIPGTDCSGCHASVVKSVTPGTPFAVTWEDPTLHINGSVEVEGSGCTLCHGDPATGRVSPPKGSGGETETSQPAVGAHEIHLASSTWRRTGQCTDCHAMPTTTSHPSGAVDFGWDGPSAMNGASPAYDTTTNACSNTYCHGSTLAGPVAGGTVNRTPVWNVVNGTYGACGTTCHTLPPGGSHPPSTSCQHCHNSTISAIDVANPSAATWTDPSLHINGTVEF